MASGDQLQKAAWSALLAATGELRTAREDLYRPYAYHEVLGQLLSFRVTQLESRLERVQTALECLPLGVPLQPELR